MDTNINFPYIFSNYGYSQHLIQVYRAPETFLNYHRIYASFSSVYISVSPEEEGDRWKCFGFWPLWKIYLKNKTRKIKKNTGKNHITIYFNAFKNGYAAK